VILRWSSRSKYAQTVLVRPDVRRAIATPWTRYDDVIPIVHIEGVKLIPECEGPKWMVLVLLRIDI